MLPVPPPRSTINPPLASFPPMPFSTPAHPSTITDIGGNCYTPARCHSPLFFFGKGPRNSNLSGRLLLSPFQMDPARASPIHGADASPSPSCCHLIFPSEPTQAHRHLADLRGRFVERAKFHLAARYNGSGTLTMLQIKCDVTETIEVFAPTVN